jgi:hypothetical protein
MVAAGEAHWRGACCPMVTVVRGIGPMVGPMLRVAACLTTDVQLADVTGETETSGARGRTDARLRQCLQLLCVLREAAPAA